jgi:glycosyltransferase involved in cell wall biosynthesis
VGWHRAGNQPTGIQRALVGTLDGILARGDIDAWATMTDLNDELVTVSRKSLSWESQARHRTRRSPAKTARAIYRRLPLASEAAKAVYGFLPLPASIRARLAARRRVMRQAADGFATKAGPPADLLIVPGGTWFGDLPDRLAGYAAAGLPIRMIVYDLIPLKYPQWVTPELAEAFTEAVNTIVPVTDRIVTLAAGIADDVRARWPGVDVRVAVPGLRAHVLPPAVGGRLVQQPYLLVVGTVEPRKNHAAILEAWRQLDREDVALVVAGRRGWHTVELEDEMARTPGLIRLDDVADADLGRLYRDAIATIHASFVEGFGLPVRESIVRGVPAIVSTGIPLDGLPPSALNVFDPHDGGRLAELMKMAAEGDLPRPALDIAAEPGWEPVVEALLD